MKGSFTTALWPSAELGNALLAATRTAGLPHHDIALRRPPILEGSTRSYEDQQRDNGRWLESAARRIGLEADSVCTEVSDVRDLLNSCAPAMLRLRTPDYDGWLVIVGQKRNCLQVVRPDLTTSLVDRTSVETAIRSPVEARHAEAVDALLKDVQLSNRHRLSARTALLHERLGRTLVGGCWLLRAPGHRAADNAFCPTSLAEPQH